MSLITDTLKAFLPLKRKTTPSGWISFDAPCCSDQRQRGGLIFNAGDAVSYHCFNCGFKTSWHPGRHVSQKMRKFMGSLGINDDIINKLCIEALRLHEAEEIHQITNIVPVFHERALPLDAELIENLLDDVPDKLIPVLEYIAKRGLYLEDYNFYWSPRPGFNNRLIIPYYYNNQIVGYTARAINSDSRPRYLADQQPNYVFGLDNQTYDKKFVIVCEGPIDAISISGCALMGSEITDSRDWLLKRLNKEIILVPDRDAKGLGTVNQAIERGWSVSMPDWPDNIKDINDAVVKLGRVTTLWMIKEAKESYSLKIQLKAKSWFKNTRNSE